MDENRGEIKIATVRNDFSSNEYLERDNVNRLRSAFLFCVWCEVDP